MSEEASHDGGVSIRRFYGNMDWFDVAEQPASFSDVPVEFEAAYKLWKLDRVKNEAAIIALLSPFVRGVFVIYALDKWEMLFEGSEDDYEGMEIQASKVNVVGIDFKTQPFPKCRVEAWFDVPVKDDFDEIDLDEWQEEEGVSLSDVIAFRWDVPKNDSTEDLDFSCGDNLGVEVVFQGAEPAS